MDQELKQRLIGYLDALEKGVTTGGEFVAEVDMAVQTNENPVKLGAK